jgi:AraC family transcriptional regulator
MDADAASQPGSFSCFRIAPPFGAAAERRVSWPGLVVERVQARPTGPTEFAFHGPRIMLRLGEAGRRADGETFLEDGTRSTVREMAGRLHLAVPGMRLWGWSRPATAWAYSTVYLDPAALLPRDDGMAARIESIRPRLGFRDEALAQTVRKLLALASDDRADRLHAETLALLLMLELATGASAAPAQTTARGGLSPLAFRRACDAMESALAEELSLAELAAAAGLSPWHFCREFRRMAGVPPHRWLAARRMERATALLAGTRRPVTEIALEVGFGGVTQFGAAFRRHAGMTPTKYRRLLLR